MSAELAVVYAALILQDDNVEITVSFIILTFDYTLLTFIHTG